MMIMSSLPAQLLIIAAAVVLSSSSSSSVASAAASSDDVLRVGSSLTPSSRPLISSSSQSFRLSFRPFSTSASSNESLRYYLAISFSVFPNGPPAWVANRNTPVSSAAYLNLSSSRGLVLIDPAPAMATTSDHIIWSTDNIANTGGVTHAQLTDRGNLILFGSTNSTDSSSAPVLWQSFQHPTDTILPFQPFSPTTDPLLSQKSYTSFDATGSRFSLSFSASGQLLQLTNSHPPPASNSAPPSPVTYWSWEVPPLLATNGSSSAFLHYDSNGYLSLYGSPSPVQSNFQISSDYGLAAIRRLTLDIDGNLRMYSWDAASHRWVIVWFAFGDECTTVQGLCGLDYAVCTYNPQPVCVCPRGFQPVDKADLSLGCRPGYNDVDYCANTKYVVLRNIDYPFNDLPESGPGKSLADCKDMCSKKCECKGFVYWLDGSGHCWMKSKFQLAGHPSPPQKYVVFLKISDSDPINVDSSGAIDGTTGVAAWSSASQLPASI